MKINVGCCGWGFFRPNIFLGKKWREKYKSILQAYSVLYPCVEINTTFYRIPKIDTVEKWRKEVSKDFQFTVKCNNIITHQDQFKTMRSIAIFKLMKRICDVLNAKLLLLQCPANFKATEENIEAMTSFLKNINREHLTIVWEPRGKSWENKIIRKICKKFNLVHCVDPFRREPVYFGKNSIAYFRLHGLGKISMYKYNFSKKELEQLKEKIENLKVKQTWVFFNNTEMYANAQQFIEILKK